MNYSNDWTKRQHQWDQRQQNLHLLLTGKVNAVSTGFIPTTGLIRRAGWMGAFFLQYILDPWRYIGMGVTRLPEDGAEIIDDAATVSLKMVVGSILPYQKGKKV